MSDIADLISNLAAEAGSSSSGSLWQVNARISGRSYVGLGALAITLGQTKSGLARLLLEAAIEQAINALPDDLQEDFGQAVDHEEQNVDKELLGNFKEIVAAVREGSSSQEGGEQ